MHCFMFRKLVISSAFLVLLFAILSTLNQCTLEAKQLFVYIVVIATCFLINFYPFYQDFVNKEVFYSVDNLWKVKSKYQF